MIRFAEVSLGQGGLPSCVKCSASAEPTFRPAADILAQLSLIAEKWPGGPGPSVAFVGAEPFLHAELPVIVMGATSARFERIRLRTGATALAAHDNAEGAIHAGVRHVEAVLLGAGEAHDELAGLPGGFASAMTGLALLRNAAENGAKTVAVTGRVPVCRHNLEHVGPAVAALAQAGAVAIELAVSEGAADAAALTRHLAPAVETGVVNGVWVSVSGLPSEKFGALAPLHAVAPSEVAP